MACFALLQYLAIISWAFMIFQDGLINHYLIIKTWRGPPLSFWCALKASFIDHRKKTVLLLKGIPVSQYCLSFGQSRTVIVGVNYLHLFKQKYKLSDLELDLTFNIAIHRRWFAFAQLSLFCNRIAWEAFLSFVYPGFK